MSKFVWLVIGVIVAVAIVFGGAELLLNTAGSDSSGSKMELERLIRDQLPSKMEGVAEEPISTRSVSCVEADGNRYECIARVHQEGRPGTDRLLIAATCDDERCIWHSVPADSSTGRESGSEGGYYPVEPESGLGWSDVTCGEIRHAIDHEDLEFLEVAGYAVAEQEIATSLDANERKLVRRGLHDLVAVCDGTTNPSYRPWEQAVYALITGEQPR